MEISYSILANGYIQLRIYNPAPGRDTEQRFVIQTDDGTTTTHGQSGNSEALTQYITIEDAPDRYISPFPNSNTGYCRIAVQKRSFFFGQLIRDWFVDGEWAEFKYPINANDKTRPTFNANYTAFDQMNNAYVANRSYVKASISNVSTKYNAGVKSIAFTVGNKSYGDPYQSDKLSSGDYTLKAIVTDTRGIQAQIDLGSISVYDYRSPMVVPASGNNEIIIARSDSEGKITADGTYLYIASKKQYSALGGKNGCTLKCKLKEGLKGNWSGEILLLNKDSNNEFVGTVNGVVLDTSYIYSVMVVAEDDTGQTNTVTIKIPSEKVYMERAGSRNSIAFGGHVTEDNAFEVYQDSLFRGAIYLVNEEEMQYFKVVIGDDGVLRAVEQPTSFSLRRR